MCLGCLLECRYGCVWLMLRRGDQPTAPKRGRPGPGVVACRVLQLGEQAFCSRQLAQGEPGLDRIRQVRVHAHIPVSHAHVEIRKSAQMPVSCGWVPE